jgi:serine/threonine protein kinase
LYKIGYDKSTKKTYLLTEWMSHTLDEEIRRRTKSENNRRLPTILGQVAKALTFCGSRLQFNHRDLHPSNVMIARSFRRIVLIDFGYSCLTWNGLQIKGPSLYNNAPHPCYKPDRDMPFLCMRLYKFYDKYLSSSLLEHIHEMLRGYVRGKSYLHRAQEVERGTVLYQPCDLGELCPSFGLSDVMDQYEFLDSPEVHVPPGATSRAEHAFRTLRLRHSLKHSRKHKGIHRKSNGKVTLRANRNVRTIPVEL